MNIDDTYMSAQSHQQEAATARNRLLTDDANVFSCNAWDSVEWSDQMQADAHAKIRANSDKRLTQEEQDHFDECSGTYWDAFYTQHQAKFFKDRKWLPLEFPELFQGGAGDHQRKLILDAGCGVGNTTLPILRQNNSRNVFIYASDISQNALDILRQSPDFDASRCATLRLDLADAADPDDETSCHRPNLPFPPNSLDAILLIFVLSAIHPSKFTRIIRWLASLLKPGTGLLLFRDYGRLDMTQLRFKTGHCMDDNFYVRSDGTCVYYFSQDELDRLFTQAGGLVKVSNTVDRRLLVNRKTRTQMFRVWLQCKYRRPAVNETGDGDNTIINTC